jgi:hypothetical protein
MFLMVIGGTSVQARLKRLGAPVVAREQRSGEMLQNSRHEIDKWARFVRTSGASMD